MYHKYYEEDEYDIARKEKEKKEEIEREIKRKMMQDELKKLTSDYNEECWRIKRKYGER